MLDIKFFLNLSDLAREWENLQKSKKTKKKINSEGEPSAETNGSPNSTSDHLFLICGI